MKKELLIAALGIGVSGTLGAATRQEVDTLLAKIAKTPAPKNLMPGASCYKQAMPSKRAEYVCPECGKKTLYTDDEKQWTPWHLLHRELASHRRNRDTLRELGWDIKLDETSLCAKCCKTGARPGDLFIEITIDAKTTRTELQSDDLAKLAAFAQKKLVWRGIHYGEERPLKPELPRIRELLGLPDSSDQSQTLKSKIK